jgi:threonine dehydratase
MALVDEMRIVSEAIIEEAISLLLDIEKTVVEGAGAAGLATLLPTKNGEYRPEFTGRNIGIILTGGNIDPRFLANVIMRSLARSGKIGRIGVTLNDRAGALHELSGIFTRNGANILEVSHQRIFGVLSAKSTRTEIEYEIRDDEALEQLLNDLDAAEYSYDVLGISGRRPGRPSRS